MICENVYTVDEIRDIAAPIAKQHGVKAMYLFGSYARGSATRYSDIDFRIEKGKVQSMYQMAALQISLEEGLHKKLDLLTTQMLPKKFLDDIRSEEVLIYAEG